MYTEFPPADTDWITGLSRSTMQERFQGTWSRAQAWEKCLDEHNRWSVVVAGCRSHLTCPRHCPSISPVTSCKLSPSMTSSRFLTCRRQQTAEGKWSGNGLENEQGSEELFRSSPLIRRDQGSGGRQSEWKCVFGDQLFSAQTISTQANSSQVHNFDGVGYRLATPAHFVWVGWSWLEFDEARIFAQLKPTRAKLQNRNLHRRVAKRYRHVEPACKKPFNCRNTTALSHNITKQLGESWLELAEVSKRWKTWLELGENLSLIKFKPNRSNSSHLKPSGWPNDTQLNRSCERRSSWLDLGGPFDQGLRVRMDFVCGLVTRIMAECASVTCLRAIFLLKILFHLARKDWSTTGFS